MPSRGAGAEVRLVALAATEGWRAVSLQNIRNLVYDAVTSMRDSKLTTESRGGKLKLTLLLCFLFSFLLSCASSCLTSSGTKSVKEPEYRTIYLDIAVKLGDYNPENKE